MEVPGGQNFKLQLCMRELLGTAFLVFAVAASGGKPEAIAGTLFCNIMIFAGPLNGGHFNPAVTLAVLVREGMAKVTENLGLAIMMIIFQISGGALGASIASLTRVRVSEGGDLGTMGSLFPAIANLCIAQPPDAEGMQFAAQCAPGNSAL